MSHRPPRAALRLLSLLALVATLLTPAAARPALADEAGPVVADNVEEWAAGAGLLYWASTCFADEFNPFAVLKRKPSAGGVERTLESINDGGRCITFQGMISAADGLYYFDASEGRIERMPLAEPYTPQVVEPLASDQQLNSRPGLIESGDHLYWLNGVNRLFRARKDGAGEVETVANTAPTPRDLLVVGGSVYWSDSAGIWSIEVGCATLPCADSKRQFSNVSQGAVAHGLLYQSLGGPQGSYRIFWVERTNSGANFNDTIRSRTCNQIMVCYLLPPEGQLPDPPPLVYAATVNWQIGDLVLAEGNLYWTEADRSTVSNNNGDVKRRAANATGPGADTIATGQAKIDDRIFVDGGQLLFARQNTGIYRLPLNAGAILRDLSAAGLEVTQGIQNLANQAPLVAEKTTYVRGYGRQLSGPSAPNVEARLVGLRGGTPLPGSPLQPINGVRALTTGAGFDRARLNDGWYFLLPASWTAAGPITLRLEIDARQIHSDPDRANNQITQAVSFQSAPPVCVMTVPVRTHTPLPSVYDPNFFAMVDQFERRWPTPDVWVFRDTEPVEELEICTYYGVPYPCHGPYELSDGWGITNGIPDRDKVIVSLWTRALTSFNPDVCDDIGAPVHFMGMVHPEADNGGAAGYASTVSSQSWVQLPDHTPNPIPAAWNAMREGSTMAQELAHNYGRKHVNCGSPDNVDTSYPYPPCQIANTGADSYYGFDVRTLQPIRPNQTADFMSYANRSWVSDYTWRALLSTLRSKAPTAAPNAKAEPDQGSSVFVTGLVDAEHSRGEIGTLLVLPANTLPPATLEAMRGQQARLDHGAAQSDYSLRLLGPGGAVLAERPLVLQPLDDHSEDGVAALFSDLFPQPQGQVIEVQLLAGTTVVDTLSPGGAAPAVSVQQPAAGATVSDTLTVGWTASDPDQADRLLLTVQYSHDGGASWHTLALNRPAGPQPAGSLTLDDLGSLRGSAPGAARIRVLASDGYNTTIATSAPFTLADRAPEPAILAPSAAQSFAAGEPVVLRGAALDPEDGGLSGAALAWKIDGAAAGSGDELVLAGLAPGAHSAELSATDSRGHRAVATVSFRVEPLSVPLGAAPALDGSCDDAAYAEASDLALRPYADGAQATARLLRSADHLWVCFGGLQAADAGQPAFVGLRADIDNSRGAQAQPSDAGFFVGEDGAVFTRSGDGAGGFSEAGPGGLAAQVAAGAGLWSAELRIERGRLGGWDHLVGLSVGHYGLSAEADGLPWPYAAAAGRPDSWATAALGARPVISQVAPFTATAGDPALTLTISGGGFAAGTVALWNGDELPTVVEDDGRLTVQVGAERLSAPGTAQISVRSSAAAGLSSNTISFVIQARAPTITQITPGRAFAGSGGLTLTVTGQNFGPGAQVLWNGEPLATRLVSAGELRAEVGAALLARGQTVNIAVRTQHSGEQVSDALPFVVESRPFQLYLPLLRR